MWHYHDYAFWFLAGLIGTIVAAAAEAVKWTREDNRRTKAGQRETPARRYLGLAGVLVIAAVLVGLSLALIAFLWYIDHHYWFRP